MGDLGTQSWIYPSPHHDNKTSYSGALQKLADIAAEIKPCLRPEPKTTYSNAVLKGENLSTVGSSAGNEVEYQTISLFEAAGRTCASDVFAPYSTPVADTSAMDGFALASESTAQASIATPMKFRVAGVVAAGANIHDCNVSGMDSEVSASIDPLCVEIMTGARFPDRQYAHMDAVVKLEDVKIETVVEEIKGKPIMVRCIYVSVPVKHRQHRRPAGSDFCKGDLIVAAGTKIEPKHVMALTSVGICTAHVFAGNVLDDHPKNHLDQHKISIGVLPTGSELLNLFAPECDKIELEDGRQRIPDSNGPFVTCTLKSLSASYQVEYLGPCEDDEQKLTEAFRHAFEDSGFDIVVTSGGVSVGRFDLVRRVLETQFHADIVLHGCYVRPGAPVMLALVKKRRSRDFHRTTVIFGAPGNPLAAAMTIRFFVEPFLKLLESCNSSCIENWTRHTLLDASSARVVVPDRIRSVRKPLGITSFLLATLEETQGSQRQVASVLKLLDDQASYKIKPFSQADFWVSVPADQNVLRDGDLLQSYNL